jgi:hypothetical protein
MTVRRGGRRIGNDSASLPNRGSVVLILVLVVVWACVDFTNGFHDTVNAVVTSIATGR